MVGVPRSKGCATCRRRKIKCDQTKPHCQACQKHGVECEGYAQHPVILQWTAGGLKKRQRFEEVASVSSSSRGPKASSSAIQSVASPSGSVSDLGSALPRHPSPGRSTLYQLQVRCLETYLPPGGGDILEEIKSSWMWTVVQQSAGEKGLALESSLAALALARVGLVLENEDLIRQGRAQYSLALTSVQQALMDGAEAFLPRTLAAVRTLSIYEHLAPTYAQVQPAGRSHEDGMAQWCLAAGPQSINTTEFGLRMWEDVRWCIMSRSIDNKRSSILGSREWRTVPWQHFQKDSLQQLFDIGFGLATVLEDFDSSSGSRNTRACQRRLSQQSVTAFTVLQELEQWFNNFRSFRKPAPSPSPRISIEYESQGSPGSRQGSPMSQGSPGSQTSRRSTGVTGVEPRDMWEASNLVYYWSFRMTVTWLLSQQASMLGSTSPSDTSPNQQYLYTPSGPAAQEVPTNEEVADSNTRLAENILDAVPFLLADETGFLGPQRLFFPLKHAMVHLATVGSPKHPRAQAAFYSLITRLRAR